MGPFAMIKRAMRIFRTDYGGALWPGGGFGSGAADSPYSPSDDCRPPPQRRDNLSLMSLFADAFVAWWSMIQDGYMLAACPHGLVLVTAGERDDDPVIHVNLPDTGLETVAEATLAIFRQLRIHEQLAAEARQRQARDEREWAASRWLRAIEDGDVLVGDIDEC